MTVPMRAWRRTFLTAAPVTAGTRALAGGLRSAHASGGDELRVALIGCGGRGTGAAVNCLNNPARLRLVALADVFANRVQQSLLMLKAQHAARVAVPNERMFVGLDAYRKAIDCGVDLVLLATPPGFRPVHYAYAVQQGKHVFMEKPCCTDAPGFRSLVATNKLADQKNLKVVVGLQRHHQARYQQGVREIHDGKLGDVRFLRVYWNSGGGGDLGPRPQNAADEVEYQLRHWDRFVWLYGDNIVAQHVHNLDIANWVMARDGDPQQAHPVEAHGMGGRICTGNYGDIFDFHCVEYTYADGTKMYSQSRHITGCQPNVGEFVHGTKGSRNVAVGGGPNLESGNPYDQEHRDLVKAIRQDTRLNEGWYGAVSSMTAVLGRMATYSGRFVRWDDAVANGPDESPARLAWDAPPRHVPRPDGRYPVAMPGQYRPY